MAVRSTAGSMGSDAGTAQLRIQVHLTESLNGSLVLMRALADIVAQHLTQTDAGAPSTSVQMGMWCPGCSNVTCQCVLQKSFFFQGGSP
jgi:protoporphyrin/coproporphyrin ferrochelatase